MSNVSVCILLLPTELTERYHTTVRPPNRVMFSTRRCAVQYSIATNWPRSDPIVHSLLTVSIVFTCGTEHKCSMLFIRIVKLNFQFFPFLERRELCGGEESTLLRSRHDTVVRRTSMSTII